LERQQSGLSNERGPAQSSGGSADISAADVVDAMSKQTDYAPIVPVFAHGRCVGMILSRGRQGVEAFNKDDRSIGLFPDQDTAARALAAGAST
jgi:hypothetical protein